MYEQVAVVGFEENRGKRRFGFNSVVKSMTTRNDSIRFILRVGIPIVLLRNFKPPKLCNGRSLKVKALYCNMMEATIFTGCALEETVFIPRIRLILKNFPFEFKQLQFPLNACFAMTINWCQRETLKFAE